MLDFPERVARQIVFSRATFGPGTRTHGVIDHIRKELDEVLAANSHDECAREWADVVILALEGLWREVAYGHPNMSLQTQSTEATALTAVQYILAKQSKNELRAWPDWRTADPNKAIEHVRSAAE